MFDVVLVHPEIPPNTGNVIRLCANTGARLHLVEPLGFSMDDKRLKRAGLDYHEFADIAVHRSWVACREALEGRRLFALSTLGTSPYAETRFQGGDAFVFGGETGGLPRDILEGFAPERRLRLPMRPGNRSVNLSNAVAVVVFEAWRQNGFEGARRS
ncbi:MAG: tRNA (uridine(34)/cytosine(34)/5-carboxymethylaminomethyluridine(34)-2'-O)-methyltransferase TrmL [Usitatibacter sp.]